MQTSDDRHIWLNGNLMRAADAVISPFDHGFTTGDGVFETMISDNGSPFAFSRHMRRMKRACEKMGLRAPDADHVRQGCSEVLAKNDESSGSSKVRVTVTSGEGSGEQTVVISSGPLPEFEPIATVHSISYTRNERGLLAGIKSTSYAENAVALKFARSLGATEAIFGNCAGNLCEGASTNVFVVEGACVVTPPLSAGCLGGITRELVIELCQQYEIEFAERDLSMSEFSLAKEAFLTSSLRDIQPIGRIDSRDLNTTENAITRWLIDLFKLLRERDIDP